MSAEYKKQGITKGTYNGYHRWIGRHYGKADHCENPECEGRSKTYEWALIKDREYSKDRKDYIQLCKICHCKYDGFSERMKGKPGIPRTEEWKKNISESLKGKIIHNEQRKDLISKKTSEAMKSIPIVKCPHCGKEGVQHGMTRWHFDNCKLKIQQ